MSEKLRCFPDNGLPIWIQLAGITYPDEKYHIIRQKSNLTVIEYVTEGNGCIMLGNKPTAVHENQVYLLTAGSYHEYYASREKPYGKIFLNACGTIAKTLPDELGINDGIYDGDDCREIFEKVADIVRSEHNSNDQTRLASLFCEALLTLAQNNRTNENSDALKMKRYLENENHRIVTVEELSRHIFRSKDYCIKCFRKEYNSTPYDYQINLKLSAAKSMLKNSNIPIYEIAANVGYFDPQYFSGLFKKKCGISPLAYRKQHRSY